MTTEVILSNQTYVWQCEHLQSENPFYCVEEDCEFKYQQVCELCVGQGQLHDRHQYVLKNELLQRLHQDKEQILNKLTIAKNVNNMQQQVRDKFELMRNHIISKLDACASQIFEILDNEISKAFDLKNIEDAIQKLQSIKQQKHRNSFRQQLNNNITPQQNEDEIITKDLIQNLRKLNAKKLDKIIYKDQQMYNTKKYEIFYQIDNLQSKLENFTKQNLNSLISNLRENKLAFPLDEFSFQEKTLMLHKHHVNKLVQISSNYFASASSDQDMLVWSIQSNTNQPVSRIQTQQQITSLEVIGKNLLMCGGPDGNVYLWNWRNKRCVRVIYEAHELTVDCIKNINDTLVATGGGDSYIRIWNISNGNLVKEINTHTEVINSLDLLDQSMIVCGSSDQNLTIWDFKKGNQVKELAGHFGQIKAVKVISIEVIASGGSDQLLKIWKWKDGEEYRNLSGHTSAIYSIEKLGFHEIVSGSIDCTIKIWNWYRSQCLKTLKAHRQTVCSILRISNKQFISASDDTTIKIWS
ncbi:hypothetical protein ABPG72_002449 [Tetrahymena utriculariae]